jgi:hypothetical protein
MGSKIEDSDQNKDWFFREIDTIHRIFNRGIEMEKHVSNKYYSILKGCRRDWLAEAMIEITRLNKIPVPSDYAEHYKGIAMRHREDEKTINRRLVEPFVPNNTDDNLRLVVMSAMFLHYQHGWEVGASAMESVRKAFDKMFPGEPYDFDKFKEKVSRVVVENYFKTKKDNPFEKERSNPSVN